jgi:pimeloyl-ACP methyl ester carboxylesterase
LNDKFEFIKFDAKTAEKNKPYLLFIHGTNSNTEGGFKELRTNSAYNKLFAFYGGRVLAFEHKTLSESPVKNVTDLLNALPNEIAIDIVSHSRGGIVADLLARCSNGEKPFDKNEIDIINKNEDFKPLKD